MSYIFGEIRQIAFVVPNIDAAMDYWAKTLGVAPFFIKRKIKFSNFIYRGSRQDSPVISIALANSGALQIELIQQHDEAPSIYLEFLTSARTGLQHVSSWVSRSEFDIRCEQLLESGYSLAQEGSIASNAIRCANP